MKQDTTTAEYITKLLKERGYTDIVWHHGRDGYFILAKRYNATDCINIKSFIETELWHEESMNLFECEQL